MKLQKSLFVHLFMVLVLSNVLSQSLYNGGHIPNQTDWHLSGLLPNTPPAVANILFNVDAEYQPGEYLKETIERGLDIARNNPNQTVLIYFPSRPGNYVFNPASGFNEGLTVDVSNIIFQGDGATQTEINVQIGDPLHVPGGGAKTVFKVTGSVNTGTPAKQLTSVLPRRQNTFTVGNLTGLSPGDWIYIEARNFYLHPDHDGDDWAHIGQIAQIQALDATTNSVTIVGEASMTYEPQFTGAPASVQTWITEITPVTDVGFENLKINRIGGQYAREDETGEGTHIFFQYAVNCWVRGLELKDTGRHHVVADRSAHIEASGNYFNDANHHGGGGYGYGVVLQNSTTNCLIENNLFRKLRHSILLQAGANSNVIIYNYSGEAHWHGSPFISPLEIVFHGNYPFSNLIEQNIALKIGGDNSHGNSGPHNAFFRNLTGENVNSTLVVENGLNLDMLPNTNLLGNVISNTPNTGGTTSLDLDLFGFVNGNQLSHDGTVYLINFVHLEDVSYYYSAEPGFVSAAAGISWPSVGPLSSSGSNPLSQRIPALLRTESGIKTYINAPTPSPTPTVNMVVANSFDGGDVIVDQITYDSGEHFDWNTTSIHTIEAFGQTWNNISREFINWKAPDQSEYFNEIYSLSTPSFNGAYIAEFTSLYNIDLDIEVPYGGTGGAMLLNGTPVTLPYSNQISVRDNITLEAPDFSETVNGVSVDYHVFQWSDGERQNPYTITPQNHIDLTAKMKGHFVANSANATLGNSGSKLVADASGTIHLIYVDEGYLFYTQSLDNGTTWSKEYLLDGSASYSCLNPNMGVSGDGHVHVVYERDIGTPGRPEYSVYHIGHDFVGDWEAPEEIDDTQGGYDSPTTPTIHVEYYGDFSVAWCYSDPLLGPKGIKFRYRDANANWISSQHVPGSDAYSFVPTISFGSLGSNPYNTYVFWQDASEQIIYYISGDPGSPWTWEASAHILPGIASLSQYNKPSLYMAEVGSSNPDKLYVTWQAIESVGSEEKRKETKTFASNCGPSSTDIPVACFQESNGSWSGLTIFRTTYDNSRMPVVTSWLNGASEREIMLAFRSCDDEISTVIRSGQGTWGSASILTTNGANPAITSYNDSEPNMAYTRYNTVPHEVVFDGNLLPPPTKEKEDELPHSRQVVFRIKSGLEGGKESGIDGDLILEIGDLELHKSGEFEKVRPRYRDSLITQDNLFEFEKVLLTESDSLLKLPIYIRGKNITRSGNNGGNNRPIMKLQVKNAIGNSTIHTAKIYQTDIVGLGNQFEVIDTVEVDLSTISASQIYFKAQLFFAKNYSQHQVAEVYDLRNISIGERMQEVPPVAKTDNLPKVFALHYNYPNPFNPTTTIRFDLPKDVPVKLKVYDVQGRLVNTLINKEMQAGYHQVNWDGKTGAGNQVASGIYFYRIQAKEFTITRRMLLIR